jgi:dipeptidase E
MKLVFYGGGDDLDNRSLDKELLSLSESKKPQITYIPSCSYENDLDFIDFVKQYKKFNVKRFLYFPIDMPSDKVMLKEALRSDIIHLSGGNTYYFLKHLRTSGLIKELKKFVQRGGILTGLSAGAIIMTPNIQTAGMPDFDKDENDENMKNFASMNLVPFEFFPHYRNSKRYDNELIKYSKKIKNPLYACPDGSGIIVTEDAMSFVGKAYCFYKGKKIAIK